MTNFIQELTEARAIRSANTLKSMDSGEIADNIFSHILTIQTMRYSPQYTDTAINYAKETLKYYNFDAIRNSGTDLHNWMSALNNPSKYADKIGPIGKTSIPELQMRTYLKNVIKGKYDANFEKRFLFNLTKSLGVTGKLKHLGREIGNWDNLHGGQQKQCVVKLLQTLRKESPQSDLRGTFEKFTKQGIGKVPMEKTPKKGMNKALKWGAIAAAAGLAGHALGKKMTGGAFTVDR